MKNSRNFFQTYSGHEKILDKFWTNETGQIPDIKNSGHIPDNISKKMQIVQTGIYNLTLHTN